MDDFKVWEPHVASYTDEKYPGVVAWRVQMLIPQGDTRPPYLAPLGDPSQDEAVIRKRLTLFKRLGGHAILQAAALLEDYPQAEQPDQEEVAADLIFVAKLKQR